MLGYAVALLGYRKLRALEEYKILARFVYLLLHRCDVVGAEQGVLRAERGRVSRHERGYSLFRAVVGDEAQADYVFVPNIWRALVAREVDSVGAHIGELSALHGVKRLFYRVSGLFKQILHELGVAPGNYIVIPSVFGRLDIVLEHLRQIAPETLRVDRAVAVDGGNIDGNYIIFFCEVRQSLSYAAYVRAGYSDAVNDGEDHAPASARIVEADNAHRLVVDNPAHYIRRIGEIARYVVVLLIIVVGDETAAGVAETPS